MGSEGTASDIDSCGIFGEGAYDAMGSGFRKGARSQDPYPHIGDPQGGRGLHEGAWNVAGGVS